MSLRRIQWQLLNWKGSHVSSNSQVLSNLANQVGSITKWDLKWSSLVSLSIQPNRMGKWSITAKEESRMKILYSLTIQRSSPSPRQPRTSGSIRVIVITNPKNWGWSPFPTSWGTTQLHNSNKWLLWKKFHTRLCFLTPSTKKMKIWVKRTAMMTLQKMNQTHLSNLPNQSSL